MGKNESGPVQGGQNFLGTNVQGNKSRILETKFPVPV